MKITFKEGTSLDCLAISSSVEYVRGINRNCISFAFNTDEISTDRLLELFKDTDKTESITVSSDDTNTYEYVDYAIFNGISITNNIINVNMCQLSLYEKQEKERIEQLNNLSEVVADMLGGAL